LYNAWTSGCERYADEFQTVCAANNGVYRPTFAVTVFFALAAIAAKCKPTANREAWPAKYILYLFFLTGMVFVPNDPLFNKIYLNIARSK